MPRFVILRHEMPEGHARHLHWDFMLQHGASLATWSLGQVPQTGSSQEVLRLADHRLAYLDYEGPVSGDRGHVHRWDGGTYEMVEWTPERIVVRLSGERLPGEVALTRLGADRYRWTSRGEV